MKSIFPAVINITLSMVSKAGPRAPDSDYFYIRRVKRSEYCYMKNFTEAANSEDSKESSTRSASVKPRGFLELPLIYTWGTEGRSRIHSVEIVLALTSEV